MAYYNQDEEELQGTGAGQPDPEAGMQAGGESATISGQGGAPGSQTAAANTPAGGAASPSGNFVGIKQYLDANKPQSRKLADNVSQFVTNQGNAARDQLREGKGSFDQAVQQNTVNLDQDLFNQAKTDATKVVQDQAALGSFKKQRDAEYKGPASFQESSYFQPVKQSVDKASKASESTSTEQGQRDLLAGLQSAKKGKVNQGALAFDSVLLQADPNAKNVLSQTRQSMNDIPGALDAIQKQSVDEAKKAAQTTADTKAAIQGAFSGEQGVQAQFERDLQKRAQDAQTQSASQAQQVLNALKLGATPTDKQLALMGMDRKQWDDLAASRNELRDQYGVKNYEDLSSYATMKNPETQINAQNIASADDYAKYAALNQLMDTDNTFLSNKDMAGTADLDSLDFNYKGASDDVKNSVALEKQAAESRARAAGWNPESGQSAPSFLQGVAIGYKLGGPVGGAIGGFVCFLEGTPILMADGSYKPVQHLRLGDQVRHGGMVIAHGISLSLNIVEYKRRFVTENHAVFDGEKFRRAKDLEGSTHYELDTPVKVYPIVTQFHVLISDNGVVYSDLMEVDTVGASDAEKLNLLNQPENLKAAKHIEGELAWKSLDIEQNTTLH